MSNHRLVAMLRAINVGGHNVKMERLRELFEELDLRGVETVIASGNVLFDKPRSGAKTLEQRIERHLHGGLGYEVATFVRNAAEMAAVVAHESQAAKPAREATGDVAVQVGFLREAPTEAARVAALSLETDIDRLALIGREIYWTRQGRISESKLGAGLLEEALGRPMTMRNITTVRKLAAKCASPARLLRSVSIVTP